MSEENTQTIINLEAKKTLKRAENEQLVLPKVTLINCAFNASTNVSNGRIFFRSSPQIKATPLYIKIFLKKLICEQLHKRSSLQAHVLLGLMIMESARLGNCRAFWSLLILLFSLLRRMCIIMLGGEDTHPWSATKQGTPY